MSTQNHLRLYIERVIVAFKSDEDFDPDTVQASLSAFREQLDVLHSQTDQACPEGAEHLMDAMTEGVALFYAALEDLERYMDELDEGLLMSAYEHSVAGDEKLRELESLARQDSNDLGYMG